MPKMMDIVRRAYQIWLENGKPEGKDQEFYYQAERELKEAEERGDPPAKPDHSDS
jgi:Protein of unknown function (DUF2934)